MLREEVHPKPRRARCHHHRVALWSENVDDVAFDGGARRATLVEPIDEQKRTPREHRLAQESIDVGTRAVLALQERIDPIPRMSKERPAARLAQLRFELVRAHEDGHESTLLVTDHPCHQLRE